MKKEKDRISKNRVMRIFTVLLAALTVFALAACGKQEETAAPEEGSEYVYVPEYIELAGQENSSFYNSRMIDGSLYYIYYNYESEMSKTQICKFSPAEGEEAKPLPIEFDPNLNVNVFCVDKEENVYVIINDYSKEKMSAEGFSMPDVFIQKYDAQGTLVYDQDITEEITKNSEDIYVGEAAVDEKGRLYLSCSDSLFLFDENGSYSGVLENNGNWINGMGTGKDGNVYVTYYDNTSNGGGMVLAEIDFEAGKTANTYNDFPSGSGRSTLATGIEKDFLINDGTKLYEYDIASQTKEEVLDWLDCDINGQFVESVGVLEDGRLLAYISDWNTRKSEFAFLSKTEKSQVAEKEEITIGALYVNQNMQSAAVAFNNSSDKYHITIKTYVDTNNWTETSYQDGITNLNNDIISKSNCPDILDLSSLNLEQLAAKGVFEDLTPYLENSSVLDEDDFMESILDNYRYDGKLVTIPASFSINTLIGRTSDVGEEMGWSLEEMIALADANEEAALFDYVTKSTLMYYCITNNMDAFVDWNTGECKFDTPEFKKLLEFVGRFPDEIDWESDTRSSAAKIAAGEVLLSNEWISDFNNVQMFSAMFGEPVTYIGFPTMDGSVGSILSTGDIYAIASKSDNKEGAWEFIEHYLENHDTNSIFSNGFPSRKSLFEEKAEKAINPDYLLDENGEPMLNENGEKIVASGTSGISYGDWEYTYHTPTQEEVDLIRELIETLKPTISTNEQLNTIIYEEAEAFYQGQKSVDEVAKIIQSRAQIYVSENS